MSDDLWEGERTLLTNIYKNTKQIPLRTPQRRYLGGIFWILLNCVEICLFFVMFSNISGTYVNTCVFLYAQMQFAFLQQFNICNGRRQLPKGIGVTAWMLQGSGLDRWNGEIAQHCGRQTCHARGCQFHSWHEASDTVPALPKDKLTLPGGAWRPLRLFSWS